VKLRRPRASLLAIVAPATALLLSATAARAGDDEAPPRDVVEKAATPEPTVAPQPWLYLDDPALPGALRVVARSRVTYTDSASPSRPFGANVARSGAVVEVGAEAGLLPWLSVLADASGAASRPEMGLVAGFRVAPIAISGGTHLVISAGYLRELSGGSGAWGRVSITEELGRARLAATAHAERVFLPGRDAIDVMVMAGVSYEVLRPLRLGVEYVAQDLEGALDPEEAERGVRHFVGPTASLELLARRLSVTAGPAIGLSRESPALLGRVGVAYAY
jgi:hypothetical protein